MLSGHLSGGFYDWRIFIFFVPVWFPLLRFTAVAALRKARKTASVVCMILYSIGPLLVAASIFNAQHVSTGIGMALALFASWLPFLFALGTDPLFVKRLE